MIIRNKPETVIHFIPIDEEITIKTCLEDMHIYMIYEVSLAPEEIECVKAPGLMSVSLRPLLILQSPVLFLCIIFICICSSVLRI